MFGRPLDLSVNISSKLFSRPEFIDKVEEAIRESGLLPGTLRLEIPESVLIDHSDVVGHQFNRLRGTQVALHLDNFGTGYASLSYLQRYPVDALKLDKSFVARMGTPGNDGVGGAIVKLARELGMGLIAEGVETVTHVEQLQKLDCPHAQGYLFAGRSPPVTWRRCSPANRRQHHCRRPRITVSADASAARRDRALLQDEMRTFACRQDVLPQVYQVDRRPQASRRFHGLGRAQRGSDGSMRKHS